SGMCLAWRPRCSAGFQNLLYRGFLTRKRFAASKVPELATVLPIGNRRYGRFGNLRYVQRALNRYPIRWGEGGPATGGPGEGNKIVRHVSLVVVSSCAVTHQQ